MNTYDINHFRLKRASAIFGLAVCLCSGVACAARGTDRLPSPASATGALPVTINWAMAERFGPGYDGNGNGRPDLPNSYGYVNPGRYEVRLSASIDGTAAIPTGLSCDWTIGGPGGGTLLRATGPKAEIRLPQGVYSVNATLRAADGRTGSARQTIRVRDILIVVLGDSLATGEGNPEVPASWDGVSDSGGGSFLRSRVEPAKAALWADGGPDGDKPRVTSSGTLLSANLSHGSAHRSTRSGLAQLAMRLEVQDPHTSVTYVCLAASGSSIDDLFASDRSNRNKARGAGPPPPAQLDELHAILGTRPADMLLLSVGLNDAKTFQVLGELMRREIECASPLRLLADYPTRQDWMAARPADIEELVDPARRSWFRALAPADRRAKLDQDTAVIFDVAEMAANGLGKAREHLDRLAKAISDDPLVAPAEIYLMEYPDPTGDAGGECTGPILSDLVLGLQVNTRELSLARERVLRPLMALLGEVADRQNWTRIDGIFASFRSHGYSAPDTWFVRAKESEELQGPRISAFGYLRGEIAPGTLHPNSRGHQVIADRLYERVASGQAPGPADGRDFSLGQFNADQMHSGNRGLLRRLLPGSTEPTANLRDVRP
jgi:lysophospholipase L1-like esterase